MNKFTSKNANCLWKKSPIILTTILLLAILGIHYYFPNDNKIDFFENCNDEQINIKGLVPNKQIFITDEEGKNFTATGITYDTKLDAYWISDYGALISNEETHPRVLCFSEDFNRILYTIDLTGKLPKDSNLQGITYDINTDSLWLATGEKIININKSGNILNNITLGAFAKYRSNGLVYDNHDDTLWVLFYDRYLIHYKKDGSILGKVHMNYHDQDHLFLYKDKLMFTVGADYTGDNNFVGEINPDNGKIISAFQMLSSYAIEGETVRKLDNIKIL